MWSSTDPFASGGRRGRACLGRARPDFDSAALFARGDSGDIADLAPGTRARARSVTATTLLPLARLVRADEIPDIMRWIPGGATLVADPSSVARVCRDPKGDYVVALAKEQRATIVPGDGDLAALKETASVPIVTPREYLDLSL
jgi:hypothetical protein